MLLPTAARAQTVKLTPSDPDYARKPASMAEKVRVLGGGAMSRWFYVELHCQGDPAEDLDEQLDVIMEALHAEPGEADADVGADLVAGTVDFCVSIQAATPSDALARVQAFVRSALHGAGIRTPGWERITELVDRGEAVATVRPSELLVDS